MNNPTIQLLEAHRSDRSFAPGSPKSPTASPGLPAPPLHYRGSRFLLASRTGFPGQKIQPGPTRKSIFAKPQK
jgi:hypothetical protein